MDTDDVTEMTGESMDVRAETMKAQLTGAIETICEQCFVFVDGVHVSGELLLVVDDQQICTIVIDQRVASQKERKPESLKLRFSVAAKKHRESKETKPVTHMKKTRGRRKKNTVADLEDYYIAELPANVSPKRTISTTTTEIPRGNETTERNCNIKLESDAVQGGEASEQTDTADILEQTTKDSEHSPVDVDDSKETIDEDTIEESTDCSCQKCAFVAENADLLRAHQIDEHNYFSCDHCPYVSATKKPFRTHLQNKHNIKELECDYCTNVYRSRKELKKHIKCLHFAAWQCPTCSTPFPSKQLLQTHINETHPQANQEMICCDKCEEIFESTEALDTHNNNTHTYRCDICPEVFSNASRLITHRQKAHPQYALICGLCDKRSPTRSAFVKHMMRHKEKQSGGFRCDVCNKIFTAKSTLYHHKRGMHNEKKKYHCDTCDMSFNFHHSWKLHTYKHTGKRPHPCNLCAKAYLTASHLKDHVDAVHSGSKKYVCPICKKAFPYENSLRMHKMLHRKDKPFCCELCGKMFVSKTALKAHEELHSNEIHNCEVCNKTYKTRSLLRAHQRRHTSDGHRYMCDICGTSFMYSSCLQSHKAIHGTEREYECKECGKLFKTSATLYSHRLVHTDINPFSCSVCAKSFKTRERLKAHEKRHLGEKPFSCALCGSTFPDRGGLSKHTKTVHASRPRFKCPVCGKLANRADNLRVHMKVHSDVNLMKLTRDELMIKDLDQELKNDSAVGANILSMPPRKKRGVAAVQYLRELSPLKPGEVLTKVQPKQERSNVGIVVTNRTEESSQPPVHIMQMNLNDMNASFQTQPADLSIHSQNNLSFMNHIENHMSTVQSDGAAGVVPGSNSELLNIQALQSVSAASHASNVINVNSNAPIQSRSALTNAHILSTTLTSDGQLRTILNTNPLLTLAEVMSSAHAQEHAHVIDQDGVSYATLQQYPAFTSTEQTAVQQASYSFQS